MLARGERSVSPPLYEVKHAIEDWNSRIEHIGSLEDYQPESDPWGDKLSFGHDSLRKSQAYQWLVSTVQRQTAMMDVQASQMDKHREWLLNTLESITPQEQKQKHRVSRRRKPPIYTVNFDLSLDLTGFIRDQEYPEQDRHSIVSRVIALTGSEHFVQALPCKEYMEQIWPSSGTQLVKLLDSLAEAPDRHHTCESCYFSGYNVIVLEEQEY